MDKNKQVTMDYAVHERLLHEIDELKSHIHQCEVEGKYKVITVTKWLTTKYRDVYHTTWNLIDWSREAGELMSLDDAEKAKLRSTDKIVADVIERELEVMAIEAKLKENNELMADLAGVCEKVENLGFFGRIRFIFSGFNNV